MSEIFSSGNPATLHVLVVDDSPAILKMTSLALRKQGYIVTTAENGQIAYDLVHSHMSNAAHVNNQGFDIVLMDFQMPVMDGLEAIQAIKRLEREILIDRVGREVVESWDEMVPRKLKALGKLSRSIPVAPIIIGFSAKSDENQIDDAYEYGMDGFLPKPFTVNGFQSLLTICLK